MMSEIWKQKKKGKTYLIIFVAFVLFTNICSKKKRKGFNNFEAVLKNRQVLNSKI